MSNPKINGDLPARESVYNIRDAVSTENNGEFQLSEDSAQSQATTFYVDYETRDGSAKHGKDYHNLKGTLVSVIIVLQILQFQLHEIQGQLKRHHWPTYIFSSLTLPTC